MLLWDSVRAATELAELTACRHRLHCSESRLRHSSGQCNNLQLYNNVQWSFTSCSDDTRDNLAVLFALDLPRLGSCALLLLNQQGCIINRKRRHICRKGGTRGSDVGPFAGAAPPPRTPSSTQHLTMPAPLPVLKYELLFALTAICPPCRSPGHPGTPCLTLQQEGAGTPKFAARPPLQSLTTTCVHKHLMHVRELSRLGRVLRSAGFKRNGGSRAACCAV